MTLKYGLKRMALDALCLSILAGVTVQSVGRSFKSVPPPRIGINITSWDRKAFDKDDAAAIDTIASQNYSMILINPCFYQKNSKSSTIDTTSSMNKKYMRDIKMYALSKGLEVMIKPIVDARTGASRTTFLPRDADKWKESYSNIVLNLLDSTDFTDSAATGIVIGCELDRIMQRRPDVFNDLALAIRARGYKGTLIYATAYGGSDDEDNIMAASKLDAELGVDFYVPNHSWYAEENRKMMSYAPDGRMCLKDTLVSTGSIELASHLERIWNIAKKPFRITEFGHRSFDMGYSCYVYSVPGRENSWVQFKCYSNITEAFEAAAQRGVRINSAAVWNTSKYNYIADLKTTSGTGFPFVSRPAGEVVRKYNQRHNSLKHELHARNNL